MSGTLLLKSFVCVQTDSDTKLLYCWMLRLRMSEQGPSTRSKRGRSSLTHFRGPRATTVAARGRFISNAISPRIHKGVCEHMITVNIE